MHDMDLAPRRRPESVKRLNRGDSLHPAVTMELFLGWCSAAIVLGGGLIAAGCAASPPAASPPSAATAPTRCEGGTLGIEPRPISRQLRRRLKLPEDVRGAAVAQV